ncbi:MAG: hypothetical protein QOF69_2983 [Solirubrobacteraceae bacterium]|nr:hypothetical protein [Solirubrobacteraceae bacterium]
MLRVPRPQRTLLPGLGVAGAVLAAVILAFMSTGAIVAFNLLSSDPQAGRSTPIVLTGPASSSPTRTPLARSRASVAAAKRAVRATPIAAAATAPPPVPRQIAVAEIIREERTAVLPPPAVQPPAPPQVAPPPAAPRPGPLAPVGDVVVQTTTGLANTLRSVTTGVGDTVAPVSSPLGEVVAEAGELLGDTVDATGNVLGDLLRPSAPA